MVKICHANNIYLSESDHFLLYKPNPGYLFLLPRRTWQGGKCSIKNVNKYFCSSEKVKRGKRGKKETKRLKNEKMEGGEEKGKN